MLFIFRAFNLTAEPDIPSDPNHTDEEAQIWQQALRDLERHGVSERARRLPEPEALCIQDLQSILYLPAYDRTYVTPIAGTEVLSFRQSGLSDRQAKIFKYPFPAQYILDLHHLPGYQAYDQCQHALVSCYLQNQRKIRIICGIGHHNQGQSLMKGIAVMILLRASFVLAYQSADQRSGGTGAIDIYLKRPD